MRFSTRAFLICFVPFALILTGSFWTIQKLVQSTVRNGLRTSLRENQLSVARLRSQNDLQYSLLLKVVGENTSLKPGLKLLVSYSGNAAAKQTVEDQLRDLCEQMGLDFLMVSDAAGTPVAGVIRTHGKLAPLGRLLEHAPRRGLMSQDGQVYQVTSVPVDEGQTNLGELSVGSRFDFTWFNTPAVLIWNGKVLRSSLPGIPPPEIDDALKGCRAKAECDVRLAGDDYISLPVETIALGNPGDSYQLRSLQDVDSASGPIQSVLNRVFLIASISIVLATLMCTLISSRSIVKPIAAMISHLRKGEDTGLLPEFEKELSTIREIQDLTSSFNRAAGAIREGREHLQSAYVEFVGTLANALDARDRYTAGHSHRVSALSCATGLALGVTDEQLNEIRIGALLHDIGKIGISDTVLQKPGKLTHEEFAMIKQHPVIGRRILEGVQGFAPYLAAVELHHENWDGTGYPKGQSGETTPLAARIIHVSDAYDAMTTDRPYRRGMSHEQAISILHEFAGRQFDPRVVEVFANRVFDWQSVSEEAILTA